MAGNGGKLYVTERVHCLLNAAVPSLKFGTFCRVYNASLIERLEWIEVVLDNLVNLYFIHIKCTICIALQNIYTSGISGCDTIEYSLVTSEGYSLTRSASECPCNEVIQVSGSSDINVTLAAAQAGSGVVLSMVSSTAGLTSWRQGRGGRGWNGSVALHIFKNHSDCTILLIIVFCIP